MRTLTRGILRAYGCSLNFLKCVTQKNDHCVVIMVLTNDEINKYIYGKLSDAGIAVPTLYSYMHLNLLCTLT